MSWDRRLAAHGRLKLALSAGLSAWFYALYFSLQRHPLAEPAVMPFTALDRLIAFRPGAVWLYESLFLLVPLGPLLMTDAALLRRYAWGFLALTGAAFSVFLLWPTVVARPAAPGGGAYAWLVAVDSPGNAFPSLHAALTVYSALIAARVLDGKRGVRGALLTWTGAVLYATLAVKQHVLADAAGGAVLGLGAAGWVLRESAKRREGGVMKLDTGWKKAGAAAGVMVALLGVGIGIVASQNLGDEHAADLTALRAIGTTYEAALNADTKTSAAKVAAFTTNFDSDIKANLATGAEVTSGAEFEAHWKKVSDFLGLDKGGKYQVNVIPTLPTAFVGNYAFSQGTTQETVTPAGANQKTYKFHTLWFAISHNTANGWKLSGVRAYIDPRDLGQFTPQQLESIKQLAKKTP